MTALVRTLADAMNSSPLLIGELSVEEARSRLYRAVTQALAEDCNKMEAAND